MRRMGVSRAASWRLFRVVAAILVASTALLVNPRGATATYVQSPPWADIVNGPMWGGLDDRPYADTAVSYLSGIGYHSFDDDNNTSPTQALSHYWAQSDAVMAFMGHGIPGQVCVEQSGKFGVVRANNQVGVSPDCNALAAADMWSMPSYTLGRMKLLLFLSCYSGANGNSGSPESGNLLYEAVYDQGVDAAVGFTGEIHFTNPFPLPEAISLFNDAFWHGLANGETVLSAVRDGQNNVYFWWCQYWGFDTAMIVGNTSEKITPAGYGS